MIGHSLPEYVLIRFLIMVLRLIAPLSGMYLCASRHLGYWLWSRWIGYYTIAEVAFYLGVYLPRSYLMQQAAQHPTPFTRAEREALFAKCFATMRDAELATGWFPSSKPDTIRRDNVIDWILWALFSNSRDAYLEEWEEETETYVKGFERLLGRELEEGVDDRVKSMKVTLDPVVACHRPLLWYFIVATADMITALLLSYFGFKPYTLWSWYRYFPPRLLGLFSESSPHPRISYWYRPHRSTTKRPILFIHGIGIGLLPYTPFLAELVRHDPDVGIIAVENFPISMRISPSPMTRAEMLEAITVVLRAHAFESCVVFGHSYGTVVAAHMMREPTFSACVAGWILVDPIPFLLHQPSVAYNFIYREPNTANEWLLWYFASRDPDIARSLARNFFWAESILWKDDLKGRKIGVSLAEKDQIVDAESVRKYLTDEDTPNKLWISEDKQLEVLWYSDLDHAQVFDDSVPRKPLHDMLARFIEIEGEKSITPYAG
ncbi:Alpha/Beta hydrolase protein [Cytidiella melzeri]|nr:Alpha/Beta hydrolase protein [Cytidiella melzeri]